MPQVDKQPANTVFSAIISIIGAIIVGVIVGMIVFWLQTREPKLVYTADETSQFRGQEYNFAVYDFAVKNLGEKHIKDITAVVQVDSAMLKEFMFMVEPTIDYSYEICGETLKIAIPELNPRETLGVSVYATSNFNLPSSPTVFVRGSGMRGEKQTSTTSRFNYLVSVFLVAFSTVLFAYIALRVTKYFRKGAEN